VKILKILRLSGCFDDAMRPKPPSGELDKQELPQYYKSAWGVPPSGIERNYKNVHMVLREKGHHFCL